MPFAYFFDNGWDWNSFKQFSNRYYDKEVYVVCYHVYTMIFFLILPSFQERLKQLSEDIEERNAKHKAKRESDKIYDVLDPEDIPNSISIWRCLEIQLLIDVEI